MYGTGIFNIPVKNGQVITGSIWYKTSGTDTPDAMLVFTLTGQLPAWVPKPITGSTTWIQLNFSYLVSADGLLSCYPWNNGSQTVWFDDLTLNFSGIGAGIVKASPASITDYYAHGSIMPGRSFLGSSTYRYGYQGQFAEQDPETQKNSFELRNWDGLLGRWSTTDPYGQYHSPYLGMGNNPINSVDPDGGNDISYNVDNGTGQVSYLNDIGGSDFDVYYYGNWLKDGPYEGAFQGDGRYRIQDRFQSDFLWASKDIASYQGNGGTIQAYIPTAMDKWSTSDNFFAQASYGISDAAYMTSQFFWDPSYRDHLNGDFATPNDRIGGFVNTVALPVAFEASGIIGGLGSVEVPVYRVYGGEANALGSSWSLVNPNLYGQSYRFFGGIPQANTMQFMTRGTTSFSNIATFRFAKPILSEGSIGFGVPEVLLKSPNSVNIIKLGF